jgi:hypothetical protein
LTERHTGSDAKHALIAVISADVHAALGEIVELQNPASGKGVSRHPNGRFDVNLRRQEDLPGATGKAPDHN